MFPHADPSTEATLEEAEETNCESAHIHRVRGHRHMKDRTALGRQLNLRIEASAQFQAQQRRYDPSASPEIAIRGA